MLSVVESCQVDPPQVSECSERPKGDSCKERSSTEIRQRCSNLAVPRAEAARRAVEARREAIILILAGGGGVWSDLGRPILSALSVTQSVALRARDERLQQKWWQWILFAQGSSFMAHRFFFLSLRPSRPSLSLATTNVSAASLSFSYTLALQQRRLHNSPSSFTERVRKPRKVAMSESSSASSASKSKRRQKADSSPPPKKPMYSIFEKKTDNPSEPAQVRWKTNGKSFIVGEAFDPQPGARVAGFDLVCSPYLHSHHCEQPYVVDLRADK